MKLKNIFLSIAAALLSFGVSNANANESHQSSDTMLTQPEMEAIFSSSPLTDSVVLLNHGEMDEVKGELWPAVIAVSIGARIMWCSRFSISNSSWSYQWDCRW